MFSNEQEIKEVEIEIDQIKGQLKTREALERLTKNPDFKLVISEGYFKNQASRLALLLGDGNINEQGKAELVQELHAIGYLNSYFATIHMMADVAESALEQNEMTLEELRSEA